MPEEAPPGQAPPEEPPPEEPPPEEAAPLVPDDTRFPLPFADDPPSTEIGVIVMGLPAEQLLSGLGLAALAEDPAAVTLLVDRVRHGGMAELSADRLVAAGLDRWRTVQSVLATAGPRNYQAPLRQKWAQAHRAVGRCELGATGSATLIYLTACWLRAAEVDAYAQARSSALLTDLAPPGVSNTLGGQQS